MITLINKCGTILRRSRFLLIILVNSYLASAQDIRDKSPSIIYPKHPVANFFSKELNCGGIMIRSSTVVNDSALIVTAQKINLMLAHIPAVRQNLSQWGAEIHVIGKDQVTSDLPEFADKKGVTYKDNLGVMTNIDDRTRGMGGIYTSCGEENLLNLPGDRYAGGQDICIHEFARIGSRY